MKIGESEDTNKTIQKIGRLDVPGANKQRKISFTILNKILIKSDK